MAYEVKADALDAALDAADLPRTAVERPALGLAQDMDPAKAAFVDGYIRKGSDLELKSVSGVIPQEGGYAVPREIDAAIDRLVTLASPIRQIANVVKVGTSGYRKLVTRTGVVSGWVAENTARPETATPQFAEIVPSFGELYANPAATQAMLDDAAFDAEAWLSSEIAAEFAKAEGAAFVAGTGVNRPKGFLAAPVAATADGTRPFGTLQYLPSGAAGAFAANPQDRLVDLVHSLKAPHRQGAVWVMNATTLAVIRKFKTTDGAFLFQPGLVAGQPNMLLGYPIVEAADMPDIAANSLSIAFGDFKRGYLIAERSDTRVLRDPYTNKPFVHFYATKRVGGTVADSEAIKLLRFAVN